MNRRDGISCPECGTAVTAVRDSRPAAGRTRRRRLCENGHRFSTIEVRIDDAALPDLLPKTKIEKTCRGCGAAFVAQHGNARYCSEACAASITQPRQKAYQKVYRKKPDYRKRKCEWMRRRREDDAYRERERRAQQRRRREKARPRLDEAKKRRPEVEVCERQRIVASVRRPTMTATGLKIGDSVPLKVRRRR